MSKPCILIDLENLRPKALERLVPGTVSIMVFLGQTQSKVVLEMARALQPFGVDAQYIQIHGTGPNALDFHIAFYIGEIAQKSPGTRFQIISKDTGFDPLVRHLTARGFEIVRLVEIPEPPAPTPNTKAAVKKAPAVATTARARSREVMDRLKKSTKPATIAKLRTMLMSWYGEAWGEKAVNAVLQSLQDSKHVTVTGTKAAYQLD